jgi:hypothetical protein
VNKSEELEKRAVQARGRVVDYKRTFASEQGKRVLHDLIATHFVMNATYTKGDPMGMAFKEGQRQVVLRIMTMMKMDPEEVERVIKESNKHVTSMV